MPYGSQLPATLALRDFFPSPGLYGHPHKQAHLPTQTHINEHKPKPKQNVPLKTSYIIYFIVVMKSHIISGM